MAKRPRKKATPVLRARLWVECDGQAALTEAGADLLDQIEVCGSLSEAARRLRFSYRRAWLLVDMMNRNWDPPLVTTATGGTDGGGSRLTAHGRHVLAAYRDLQIQLEFVLGRAREPFKSPE
jgi:molybdate transport system regulatory protein